MADAVERALGYFDDVADNRGLPVPRHGRSHGLVRS